MMKDKLFSDTITYLKFPLIVLVVFAHFNLIDRGFSVDGIMYDLKGCDVTLIKYILLILSHELAHVTVPIFFIISGFLFFKEDTFDKDIYTNKIRKRIKIFSGSLFFMESYCVHHKTNNFDFLEKCRNPFLYTSLV